MKKSELIKQLQELADCSDTQNIDESRGYYMGIQAAISIIKNSDRIIYDDKKINMTNLMN